MADDTLRYAIAGLGELADLYAKSKALDLAQSQFMMQREDRIADRELRAQERADARTFQKEMFTAQKEFQVLTREDQQAFQAEQARIALASREKQGQLQVLLNREAKLYNEKRASEKEYEKLFGVSPVYSTSNSRQITDDMSKGTDDLISMTRQDIQDRYQDLADIDAQEEKLMGQWRAYEDISTEIAGLNEVVQIAELRKWQEKELAEGGMFEGETDLPGARAAWKSEFATQGARSRQINIITRQKKAEADALAEPLWETISTTLTDDKNLGTDPDDWKAAFPTSYNIALKAFSNPNFEDFMYTYNNAPQEFRNELAAQGGINEQLGHLISHAENIRSLQLEAAGWTPEAAPKQETFNYDSALNKLRALDVTEATKEELFRWHKQNVPAYAKRSEHKALFSEVENILHSRGETGDFGTEYVNWINTGKLVVDEKDPRVYAGQKDRFGKTGVSWTDKRAGDYLWDSDMKLIYRMTPSGTFFDREKGGYEKEYYIKPEGSDSRKWVSHAEAIDIFPAMERLPIQPGSDLGVDPGAARLPMPWTYGDDQFFLDESAINPITGLPITNKWARSLASSARSPRKDQVSKEDQAKLDSPFLPVEEDIRNLEGWGRNPFVQAERTEADLVEEQRLLDSLEAIRTWDDVLGEWREGDEAYKHYIDSSYQAIEDSLTKLGEDTEGRELFGRAWDDTGAVDPDYMSNIPGRSNYLDAQAFENLTGINPLWKFDYNK